MKALPPGTILQLTYLRERLQKLKPGLFLEIGPGSGEISSLLLTLGWRGKAYDLEPSTVEHLRVRFAKEIQEGRYTVNVEDYLTSNTQSSTVDLIISCMVMEHLDDTLEPIFMQRSHDFIKPAGIMIGFVPSSPSHWGIEDDIAGHCRRYTRDSLQKLISGNRWQTHHMTGLTYPISNVLLPLSNFLVQRSEKSKLDMSEIEKTKASGIRHVKFKTTFPSILSLLLNRWTLTPLHWMQKIFSGSDDALVLYFEARPIVD